MNTTYDVRLWAIREHTGKDRKTGKPRSTYRVRWVVAGEAFASAIDEAASNADTGALSIGGSIQFDDADLTDAHG